MNLDDLSNKELDALAATEVMGWHLGEGLRAGFWLDANDWLMFYIDEETQKGEYDDVSFELWNPAIEGNEHQAMMVAAKIPGPLQIYRHTDGTWSVRIGSDLRKVARDALGRAIVLAALRALEVLLRLHMTSERARAMAYKRAALHAKGLEGTTPTTPRDSSHDVTQYLDPNTGKVVAGAPDFEGDE